MKRAIAILVIFSGCCPRPSTRPTPEPRVAESVEEIMSACSQGEGIISCPTGSFNRLISSAIDCGEALDRLRIESDASSVISGIDLSEARGRVAELENQRWWWAVGGFAVGALALGFVALEK